MNKQVLRIGLRLSGIITYLVGLGSGLFIILMMLGVYIESIFPLQPHQREARPLKIDCPHLMARREAGLVAAYLSNPFDIPMGYTLNTVTIPNKSQPDFELVAFSGPEESSRLMLAPGETVDLAWTVTVSHELSRSPIFLSVEAVSDYDVAQDRENPRRYPWPPQGEFSYRGTCAIALLPGDYLTGTQLAMAPGVIMLAGGGLWLYTHLPLSKRGYVWGVIALCLGLVVLILELILIR
jgi:hypothetical protein